MNLAEQVQTLKANLGNLPTGKQSFASSLIQQFERRRSLSPNQTPYIESMLAQATSPKPAAVVQSLGDFGGVIALFKKAGQKLKFPKITLQVEGEAVILKMAGPRSSTPGSINVVSEGGFGVATFYGRISPQGEFVQGGRASDKLNGVFGSALVTLLRVLASDPIKVVQEQARLTGHCIFCNKHLTDARSKAAGFGPVCADKWDLGAEWKAAAKNAAAEEEVYVSAAPKKDGLDDLFDIANEYEAQLAEEEANETIH